MSKFEIFLFTVLAFQGLMLLIAAIVVRRRLASKPVFSPSPIGYKHAFLRLDPDAPFKGVTDGSSTYSWDSEAQNANGFHSFYDLKTAQAHPQTGNVMLEVFNSGEVQYHKLGAESRHQRVLQVLVNDCDADANQAVAWTLWGGKVRFFCSDCVQHVKTEPLASLETWINERSPHPIVVSTVKATHNGARFTPTVADSNETV